MHIYGNSLEKYVSRELPPDRLATLDAHISNCLFCAHALADQTAAESAWERRGLLQRLVPVKGEPAAAERFEEPEARAA
jgi:anti-sigma factor RsiW